MDTLLALPEREIERWRLYWNLEPWGAYRDNLHVAVLASTFLAPHVKEVPTTDRFMLEPEWKIKQRQRQKVIAMMEAASRIKPPKPKPKKKRP